MLHFNWIVVILVEIFYAKSLAQCLAHGNHFKKLSIITPPPLPAVIFIVELMVDIVVIDFWSRISPNSQS